MTAYGMLKAAISAEGRSEHDFYPTPPEAVVALLPEIADFPHEVWEPACGTGSISEVLESAGFKVISTDLVERGYGHGCYDFLKTPVAYMPAIVTNPPFGALAEKFIEHAVLTLRVPFVAMLLNVNFWHAKSRTALFDARRPRAILALTWRPDFTGSNNSYFNCIWTVWRPERVQDPIYRRLDRPVDLIG